MEGPNDVSLCGEQVHRCSGGVQRGWSAGGATRGQGGQHKEEDGHMFGAINIQDF